MPGLGLHQMTRPGRGPSPAMLLGVTLALLAALGLPRRALPVSAQAVMAHYTAGWNLVAAPTGTLFPQATGTFYTLRPLSRDYQPVSRTGVIGGRSLWAYFARDTDMPLGTTAASFTRLVLPAEQYALIGNPSTTQTLPISGADVAFAYTPGTGYQAATSLRPGQGAFVLRHSDGDVIVGTIPTNAMEDQIRDVQVKLTSDASDPSSFGMIPAIADPLLAARRYDVVQAMQDDVNASFADGLAYEQAATPVSLTETQRADAVTVREDLAHAQTASATGDTATADSAVTHARGAAQAEEDDAAATARTQGTSSAVVGLGLRYAAITPASLARYGTLCTATVPALALNQPPSMQFVALVGAVLNNQPPPAAATPTPASR